MKNIVLGVVVVTVLLIKISIIILFVMALLKIVEVM